MSILVLLAMNKHASKRVFRLGQPQGLVIFQIVIENRYGKGASGGGQIHCSERDRRVATLHSRGKSIRFLGERPKWKKKKLSNEKTRKLDAVGFIWGPREAKWEKNFSLLREYSEKHGHSAVPLSHEVEGIKLGNWVGTQRKNKKNLSKNRIVRLEGLDFVWSFTS